MINSHKIIKTLVLGLAVIVLFIVLIYWLYPEIYLSFISGYGIKTISEYCVIKSSFLPYDKIDEKLRVLPDPKPIFDVYFNLETFSLLAIKIAFVISFIFTLTTKETLSKKYRYTILIVLFLSIIIFYWAQSGDFGSCWS